MGERRAVNQVGVEGLTVECPIERRGRVPSDGHVEVLEQRAWLKRYLQSTGQ